MRELPGWLDNLLYLTQWLLLIGMAIGTLTAAKGVYDLQDEWETRQDYWEQCVFFQPNPGAMFTGENFTVEPFRKSQGSGNRDYLNESEYRELQKQIQEQRGKEGGDE